MGGRWFKSYILMNYPAASGRVVDPTYTIKKGGEIYGNFRNGGPGLGH